MGYWQTRLDRSTTWGMIRLVEIDEFIENVDVLSRVLISGTDRPYDVGIRIDSLGMQNMTAPFVGSLAEKIFLIWASLTDLVDGPRGREPGAEASASLMMIRAAEEWLAISSNETERELYLERWMHEECGYERP
jgi:hypothetical protein